MAKMQELFFCKLYPETFIIWSGPLMMEFVCERDNIEKFVNLAQGGSLLDLMKAITPQDPIALIPSPNYPDADSKRIHFSSGQIPVIASPERLDKIYELYTRFAQETH